MYKSDTEKAPTVEKSFFDFPDELKEMMLQQIGNEVRIVRRNAGLTQMELARRIGHKHNTYIRRLEKGQESITIYQLARISAAMGCDMVIGIVPKSS